VVFGLAGDTLVLSSDPGHAERLASEAPEPLEFAEGALAARLDASQLASRTLAALGEDGDALTSTLLVGPMSPPGSAPRPRGRAPPSGSTSRDQVTHPGAASPPAYAGREPVLVHNCTADELLKSATQVRGKFPNTAKPREILVRRNPQTGRTTHYQVFAKDGMPEKRIDVAGRAHGGVPTPHVLEFERHTDPKTGRVFAKPKRTVRRAHSDEIPTD